MNVSIVILSDPKDGSEESVGRVFNALAAAYELKGGGENVQLLFQGTGTRWLKELSNPAHPVFSLFQSVKDCVAGASCGCADVFCGEGEIESTGFARIGENAVPNTSGLPSLAKLMKSGHQILVF